MDTKQDSKQERGLESTRFLRNFDEFRVHQGTPKCVLVVDGGGLKGYMTIQILEKLEEKIKNKSDLELHQVFDLILGTSTGGLISIGLGKLRMTCKEISELYQDVGEKVFAVAKDEHSPKDDEKEHSGFKELESNMDNFVTSRVTSKFVSMFRNLAKAVSTIKNVGSLSHTGLENVFKEYIKKKTNNEDALMYDKDSKNASPSVKDGREQTKCGVIATLCNNDDFQSAMIIRSYNMHDEIKHTHNNNHIHSRLHGFFPGFHECKIWEAARATSAAPTYFKDMFIKMPKSIAIDTIECNICYATGLAKNPITHEFDMDDLYLDTVKDNKILHECAHDIYDLIETSKDNNKKKEEDEKEDDKKTAIIEKMKKLLAKNGVSKSAQETLQDVMKAKYEMRFQDGGLSANSPVMIGFTEATRLWSDSDIVMLSVGTGQILPQKKDFFTYDGGQPHIDRVFATIFGAKDLTALFDAYALSTNHRFPFHFQRMNPQVPIKGPKNGGNLLDMAAFKNMDDWKQLGQDFAESHELEIESWAQFLVDNYKEYQYENSKETRKLMVGYHIRYLRKCMVFHHMMIQILTHTNHQK